MTITVDNVSKVFGGIAALSEVGFAANTGELTALIGPNGAGKTTMFNCIAGFHRPTGGTVWLDEVDITGRPPARILRDGLARTFQLIRSFEGLTVLESVMTAGHWRSGQGFLSAMFALPSLRRSERRLRQEARETLAALGIAKLADQRVHELPYGQQRLVEIAKVLATGAHTLLLDEPAAGLHDDEAQALKRVLAGLLAAGKTVLLIEHNMPFVLSIADRVVVLDFGEVIATGPPGVVARDQRVIDSYLGKEMENA